jgi:hypothetical protein
MWFDSATRKQIVIGVLSSLVLIFLVQPFLHASWRIIDFLGTNVSESFSRGVYIDAALGLREVHSFLLLALVLVTLAGFGISSLITHLRSPDEDEPGRVDRALERAFRIVSNPWIRTPLGILFLLSITMIATDRFADLQLNASFNQRMAALAPDITDLEAKRLRSRWASMKSREDYVAITKSMDITASQKGVTLPKVLWQ